MREGKGKMKYGNGDFYEGFWSKNLRHGKGIYKYSNGDVYDGEF